MTFDVDENLQIDEEALYVFVRLVAIYPMTVTDVREEQGTHHSGQEFTIRDMVTHVGQPDENTVTFLDEG